MAKIQEAVDLKSIPKVAVSSGYVAQLLKEAEVLADAKFVSWLDQGKGEWFLYIPAQEEERYRQWARGSRV